MTDEVQVLGPFKSHNNNVFLGYELLLLNDPLTVSLEVFRQITPADMPIFMKMIEGKTPSYVESFAKFFNVTTKLNRFLDSNDLDANKEFNTSNKLDLTDEELSAGIAYRAAIAKYATLADSIKAKFSAKFKRPSVPFVVSTKMDLNAEFGDLAEEALLWINDPKHKASAALYSLVRAKPDVRNLLRVRANGKTVENLLGASEYRATLLQAKKEVEFALKTWANPDLKPNTNRYADANERGSLARHHTDIMGYTRTMYVYPNKIAIGCQIIPRSEVERLAAQQGWSVN